MFVFSAPCGTRSFYRACVKSAAAPVLSLRKKKMKVRSALRTLIRLSGSLCIHGLFPASTRKKPLGISNTNTMPSTMAMAAFIAAKPLLIARRICAVTR